MPEPDNSTDASTELESSQPSTPDSRRETNRRRWHPAVRWPLKILACLLIAYFFFMFLLLFNETSLVYPGSSYPKGNWEPEFEYEEVALTAADGTELVAWYLPPPDDLPSDRCRTILYCHGNAENVAEVCGYHGQKFRHTLDAEFFVFDYRGYGKSKGTPDEPGVFQDAEAALDWICKRSGKQPEEIVLVGHSLGGGPAVHLAQTRGCQMLVLQRTYSSLPEAASENYPYFPVGWLMRNRMNSVSAIKDCPQPLFQSHGTEDKLIPIKLARRLHAASPAKEKRLFEVEGMSHWDPLPADYWTELAAFVDRIAPVPNR